MLFDFFGSVLLALEMRKKRTGDSYEKTVKMAVERELKIELAAIETDKELKECTRHMERLTTREGFTVVPEQGGGGGGRCKNYNRPKGGEKMQGFWEV